MNSTARDVEQLQLVLATLRRAGGTMNIDDLAARIGLDRHAVVEAVSRLQMVHGDEDRGYEFVDIDIDGETVDLPPNLDQGLGRRPLPLTASEFAALAAAVRAACSGPSQALGHEAAAILAKVIPHVEPRPADCDTPVSLEIPTLEPTDARWTDIQAAARTGEELEIEYWSASRDEVTRRLVSPKGLVNRNGTWYLDAVCRLRHDERRFRMDRIVGCRRTGRHVSPPESTMAPGGIRQGAEPPEALVRFAKRVAPWIRERHPPADVTERPDGTIDVRIPYDSEVFLAGWVLSFAGDATVVLPATVRREILLRLVRSFGSPAN